METDLSVQDMIDIGSRIDRAFKRRPIMPFESLQYRLGEVGPKRIHPRMLDRALLGLQRTREEKSTVAGSFRPWKLANRLYASPSLAENELASARRNAAPALEELARVDWRGGFQMFTEALRSSLPGYAMRDAPEIAETLTGQVQVQSSNAILEGRSQVHTNHITARIWVCQNSSWLHPDDPALWNFLIDCERDGHRPIIVARIIDPATFVLLKTLGAIGLQFYSLWAAELTSDVQAAADEIGWIHVRSGEQALDHPVVYALHDRIEQLIDQPWSDDARTLLRGNAAMATPSPYPERTERLAAWAQCVDSLPDRWRETLNRWISWGR